MVDEEGWTLVIGSSVVEGWTLVTGSSMVDDEDGCTLKTGAIEDEDVLRLLLLLTTEVL